MNSSLFCEAVLQPGRLFRRQVGELGIDQRQQLLAVLVTAANHSRLRESGGREPGIQGVDAADFSHHQIGGGVVAGDHHLRDEIAIGRIQPKVVELQHTAAVAEVGTSDGHTFVQIERPGVGELKGTGHDRELDDAGAAERLVAAHRGFLARAEVLDVDPGAGWKGRQVRIDQLGQAGRCLGRQGSTHRENEGRKQQSCAHHGHHW